MTELYHTDICMPEHLRKPIFEGMLTYGFHAKSESAQDKYGSIQLPKYFDSKKAKLIETEWDPVSRRILKQVWRQRLDDKRDLVLVIGEKGFVRTVWCNLLTDKHRTLNPSKYVH